MDGRRMKSNGLHATHDAPTAIVLMKYVLPVDRDVAVSHPSGTLSGTSE
jgi:hypothetical protein